MKTSYSANGTTNTAARSDESSDEFLVPPQALEAEQSVLGSMMLEGYAIEKALEILRPGDFYRLSHRTIFRAIESLTVKGEPIDLTTLPEELKSRNDLEVAGGLPYLAGLLHVVPTAANVEHYARIVQSKSVLRELIGTAGVISQMGYKEQHRPVEDVVDKAEQMIFKLSRQQGGQGFSRMGDVASSQLTRLDELSKSPNPITGRSTGYHQFDKMTAGLQRQELVILAARPSMGKTALAMSIAQHAAREMHHRSEKGVVAIFSLEMSEEQLVLRALSSEALIDSQKIRMPSSLSTSDWSALTDAAARIDEDPIWIEDSTEITVTQIRARCRRLKAEHGGLGLVVVDYLQLIRGDRQRGDSFSTEVGEIARALKSMARELDVPVMALSQLSRNSEKREDKRPMLSDLRDSGNIEAEADVVAFVFRPAYYDRDDRDPELPEDAEIIIGKQRNGPTGTVRLNFIPKYAAFKNKYDSQEDDQFAQGDPQGDPQGGPFVPYGTQGAAIPQHYQDDQDGVVE